MQPRQTYPMPAPARCSRRPSSRSSTRQSDQGRGAEQVERGEPGELPVAAQPDRAEPGPHGLAGVGDTAELEILYGTEQLVAVVDADPALHGRDPGITHRLGDLGEQVRAAPAVAVDHPDDDPARVLATLPRDPGDAGVRGVERLTFPPARVRELAPQHVQPGVVDAGEHPRGAVVGCVVDDQDLGPRARRRQVERGAHRTTDHPLLVEAGHDDPVRLRRRTVQRGRGRRSGRAGILAALPPAVRPDGDRRGVAGQHDVEGGPRHQQHHAEHRDRHVSAVPARQP